MWGGGGGKALVYTVSVDIFKNKENKENKFLSKTQIF